MCAKALKRPSLARSVPKPLKGPSLARSVPKPLKGPSLARYVLKPFKMLQEGEGEGEGAKRRYTLCNETLFVGRRRMIKEENKSFKSPETSGVCSPRCTNLWHEKNS